MPKALDRSLAHIGPSCPCASVGTLRASGSYIFHAGVAEKGTRSPAIDPSRLRAKPNLAEVLAAIRPGCAVRLSLDKDQKGALSDRDGRLARDVVRHILGARAASVAPASPRDTFPLTEHTFQAVARKLGESVGIKRSRQLLRRLVAAGVLESAGSYRQAYSVTHSSGFRVPLYRLGCLSLRSALASPSPDPLRRQR